MNFAGLFFLLIAQYICGRGLLRLFKIEMKPLPALCMSMMTGVVLVSFAPCLLQLFNRSIDVIPAIIAVVIVTALMSIPLLIKFRKPQFKKLALPLYYEWPFILVITFFMLLAAWRSFYYPPYARDMLAGPELLAEYAVREHNMISSVFTIDLQSTNNYFKSPFITCLQILYKLLVCPFGQIWMVMISIPFWIWLYTLLRERIHPLIAGFLLFFFMTMPEVYSYSYIMLYDFDNMVFFFGGYYFLIQYFYKDQQKDFLFSALLFGFATYIRTETVLMIVLTVPMILLYFFRSHYPIIKMVKKVLLFIVMPTLFYVLCIYVFVSQFVPLKLDIGSQVTSDLNNISVILKRLKDIPMYLVFSYEGVRLFGYFIIFFIGLLLAEVIIFRKFSRESRILLYGILVVYLGLPLLGYLIPLVDLTNTTKRGLFKMLPLMLLFMSDSNCFQYLSQRLIAWEQKTFSPVDQPKGALKSKGKKR